MSLFDSMQINSSGLSLERFKLDTISTNIANVNTTRTEEGGPYLKKTVAFEESFKKQESFFTGESSWKSYGVAITGVEEDAENVKYAYEPDHPDADDEGFVAYPNINVADEMIELLKTLRTYDANVTALNASKEMIKKALEISR